MCSLVWRNGERVGAGFLSKKELRERFEPAVTDPKPQKAPAAPGSQRRALKKSACPVADVEVLES